MVNKNYKHNNNESTMLRKKTLQDFRFRRCLHMCRSIRPQPFLGKIASLRLVFVTFFRAASRKLADNRTEANKRICLYRQFQMVYGDQHQDHISYIHKHKQQR